MAEKKDDNDSLADLVADVRAWLEWQQFCGTDSWLVENMSSWERLGKSNLNRKPVRSTSLSAPKVAGVQKDRKKSVEALRPKENKPPLNRTPKEKSSPVIKEAKSLSPWWEDILNSGASIPTFNADRVDRGAEGIQSAYSFRQKHCVQKTCKWGVGRIDAPVVLVEAGQAPLAGKGLEMLSLMRKNVLKLPKEKLYWIPVNPVLGCSICDSLVLAQINAIQPKAVLIMGLRPLEILQVSNKEKALRGEEVKVQINSGALPAVCTFHPMYLVENPSEKRVARDALFLFKRILQRLGIV